LILYLPTILAFHRNILFFEHFLLSVFQSINLGDLFFNIRLNSNILFSESYLLLIQTSYLFIVIFFNLLIILLQPIFFFPKALKIINLLLFQVILVNQFNRVFFKLSNIIRIFNQIYITININIL